MHKIISEIGDVIKGFQQQLEEYLPKLELEVNEIINKKITDSKEIENYLDTLLSLSRHGVGNSLYIKLLEYYKTVDIEGAKFYWEEYDNLED